QGPLPVHCELGPVLINRTAVYKMCRAVPRELTQRGFRVRSSAVMARLANDSLEADGPHEQRLFSWSQRWLHWAINHPRPFIAPCRLTSVLPHFRHYRGVRLFLDPLYVLFFGCGDDDVVIVYDITTVSDLGWHHPGVTRLYETAFRRLAC